MKAIKVALIGDYNPEIVAHQAIPIALEFAAMENNVSVTPKWCHTQQLADQGLALLKDCQATWCVPGSPYANMEAALLAIQAARETGRPFLGTCGGFQHAVVEYARNVLGHQQADHAESNPDAEYAVISRLSCSLVEKGGELYFTPDSRLRAIYGTSESEEKYHCNYGLNPQFESWFADSDILVAARDADGEVRAIEHRNHPFFFATLFQPERSALRKVTHPLITAFLHAATER